MLLYEQVDNHAEILRTAVWQENLHVWQEKLHVWQENLHMWHVVHVELRLVTAFQCCVRKESGRVFPVRKRMKFFFFFKLFSSDGRGEKRNLWRNGKFLKNESIQSQTQNLMFFWVDGT